MKDWIIGPKLARYLEQQGVDRFLDSRQTRAFYGWKYEGRCSDVYFVDELLIQHNLHLSMLPDDFYCDHPKTLTNGSVRPHTSNGDRPTVPPQEESSNGTKPKAPRNSSGRRARLRTRSKHVSFEREFSLADFLRTQKLKEDARKKD
jgi:hypothetical protein